MSILKTLLVALVFAYCGLAALLYVAQRSMMYFPHAERVSPRAAGFPAAEEITLSSADGERVLAWHMPPHEGRPVIVYFHGNGGNLSHRATRFRALADAGYGIVALSYRGYGGSSGSPTQAGIMLDAAAAYDEATRRYPGRLVLWGESLGTAVAVEVAAGPAVDVQTGNVKAGNVKALDVKAVVLEAPFTSTLALAESRYPFLPVAWMMKDQYRSDLLAGRIRAPVLVMHGEKDDVVPIRYGEALYTAITAPKRFVRFAAGNHVDLGAHGAVAAAREFIDGLK
jgi:fermentation-respiration switch protein FrsA (DUF1100 family)